MKLGLVSLGFLFLGVMSVGCSSEDEEFEFGRADMEAAVFGTWTGTVTPPGETAAPLTLEIRARDDVARDLACASRNFESAPGLEMQCSTDTTLAVSATLVAGDGASPTELDGDFIVGGTTFSGGDLQLLDRGSIKSRVLAIQEGGAWTWCEVVDLGDCTLDARVED
jgi:hypothetical protein